MVFVGARRAVPLHERQRFTPFSPAPCIPVFPAQAGTTQWDARAERQVAFRFSETISPYPPNLPISFSYTAYKEEGIWR